MIVELITCDACDWTDRMVGSVVPSAWLVTDSGHYCGPACLARSRHGEAS